MEAIRFEKFTTLKISDTEVIKRVMEGEKALFEIIMRRHNQKLFRMIRSYVKEKDDVQDLMQETYIKAYRKLDQFNGAASFSTWLIRIGINEALQHLRKQKREVQQLGSKQTIDDGIHELANPEEINTSQDSLSTNNKVLLEKAIDQLPEKYRVIFVLSEVEGLTNKEIMACLSITESNVKVRLHRAKKLLKEVLFKLTANTDVFEFGNTHCDQIVARVMKRI